MGDICTVGNGMMVHLVLSTELVSGNCPGAEATAKLTSVLLCKFVEEFSPGIEDIIRRFCLVN